MVDLTNSRSSGMGSLEDPGLMSPKASFKKDHFSSEKKQTAEKDKIPVAQIVMQGGKKTGTSGLKNFQLSSQTALCTSSGLKKTLE